MCGRKQKIAEAFHLNKLDDDLLLASNCPHYQSAGIAQSSKTGERELVPMR